MSRLLLVLGLVGTMALLWSEPSVADAVETTAQESATTARFEDNSRCALGSHWLSTTRKPSDYDAHQIAEWVSSSGPTGRYVAPRFRCFYARLYRDPVDENPARTKGGISYDSEELWCGPGVSVLLTWEIFGGEAPYRVSAVGHESGDSVEEMQIPCLDMRRAVAEASNAHMRADERILLEDALGATPAFSLPIRFVVDPPSEAFTGMRIVAGWYEASALAISDWWPAGRGKEQIGPFVSTAVGRYRPAGEEDWIYFDLSHSPPQSDRPYNYPVLMSPLRPNKQYEVQGAWIWAPRFPCVREECFKPAELLPWFPPERLRWSASQRFWTGGPVNIDITVKGNSVAVRRTFDDMETRLIDYPAGTGGAALPQVVTWLTSEDWPGVIWTYGRDNPRPSADEDLESAMRFISKYSGLPENSRFTHTMQETLPSSFRQALRHSLAVTTGSAMRNGTAPQVDPSDVSISLGTRQIAVKWTDQHPYLSGTAALYFESGRRRIGEHALYQKGSRVGIVFKQLSPSLQYRLYVSFRSREPLEDGIGLPNMCIIRDIQVPSAGSDAYLDRYFITSLQEPAAVKAPESLPSVKFNYPFNYVYAAECRLDWYAYP